ncbi:hypothetical protein ACHAW6_005988 [Cyclotella cf. meneghiniana]
MPTMAASPTMLSSATARNGNNDSPTVGSIPTSQTTWLKKPSGTSLKEEGSSSCMPWQGGRKWWIWHYGHTHCIMQCIFSTLLLFFPMGPHDWNYFRDPR